MKHAALALTACLLLAACAGDYRHPSLSGDAAAMSADTLCFRYASSKAPALDAEIDARDLDCAAMLREDPLYRAGPDRDAADRITR